MSFLLQVYIELTLNQIIRSGIPVFTAGLGVVVEKKMPTRTEFFGIVILTAGVVTCLYEGSSVKGSLQGILMCLASTLCGAAMLSFSGAVLDPTEKMDPVRLNFYCAPVAVAVSLPCIQVLSVCFAESVRQFSCKDTEWVPTTFKRCF